MAECNVDDILCQFTALSHLKGLKSVLGDEKYRVEFPELQSLDEKIASREVDLRESLGRCVRNTPDESTEIEGEVEK